MITRAAMAMPSAAPRAGRLAFFALAAVAFSRARPARDGATGRPLSSWSCRQPAPQSPSAR